MIFALYLNYLFRVFFSLNLKEFSEFRLLYISSLFLISSLFNFQGSFNPQAYDVNGLGTPDSFLRSFCLTVFVWVSFKHQTLSGSVLSTTLSAQCLAIISNTFYFVNTFFKLFLKNFFVTKYSVKY